MTQQARLFTEGVSQSQDHYSHRTDFYQKRAFCHSYRLPFLQPPISWHLNVLRHCDKVKTRDLVKGSVAEASVLGAAFLVTGIDTASTNVYFLIDYF